MLLVTCAVGCAALGDRAPQPASIRFVATPLPASLCGDSSIDVEPASLRFFVSRLAALTQEGEWRPIHLELDGQTNAQAALLAFELDCDQESSAVLSFMRPDGMQSLSFTLGVPAEANHANPLQAKPPLNNFDMHWAWQGGYKFLSLDLGNVWSFHLGSTGCFSESPVRPPDTPCRQPNRVRVRVDDLTARPITLRLDIAALLANMAPSALDNCVGPYHDKAHCRQLVTRLGLDANSGRCVNDCRGQQLVRLVRQGEAP